MKPAVFLTSSVQLGLRHVLGRRPLLLVPKTPGAGCQSRAALFDWTGDLSTDVGSVTSALTCCDKLKEQAFQYRFMNVGTPDGQPNPTAGDAAAPQPGAVLQSLVKDLKANPPSHGPHESPSFAMFLVDLLCALGNL
ncbi:uncharacterized protein LOC126336716 [Schistocerca gregaria]|uniref:uncharacterized protein LOC126336716 n=1 Tax=Schistocerca gregaria TaxID=7010 RepID=UPI00211E0838|nr:uncharacterized protein LOC126336716 [Schistocerca gregaria]